MRPHIRYAGQHTVWSIQMGDSIVTDELVLVYRKFVKSWVNPLVKEATLDTH